MRKIWILFLGIVASGCVSMAVEPQDEVLTGTVVEVVVNEQKPQEPEINEATSIEKVYLGMSEKDVSRIMGDEMVVGYQKNSRTGVLETINMGTVYKTETLKAGEKAYFIKYYFTSSNKADGIISEDELTPLVFEDSRLVGTSWDFLFRLKNELNF